MADFNIKEITTLRNRVQVYDKIILIVWIALIITIYYDLTWIASIGFIAQCTFYILRRSTKKKLAQKETLAQMVEERTTDLRQERDKVVQESKELSDALEALAKAQDELVRKEKMATVGNLTSGLLDRILNPVNYINNFSGLTINLAKDLRDELSEIKDNIPAENYENLSETLDLINVNLDKIHEHGNNTVRIVKAMEEIINNKHGNMTMADIRSLCRVNIELIRKHHAADIAEHGITISGEFPTEPVMAEVDMEEMNKVLYHLLDNSIYAIIKKLRKESFTPEITVGVSTLPNEKTLITIRDNGIGIEKNNLTKIFEPFFTTKSTSEAAGIGLYLCKEIILNHKGTITATSEKDLFTEFRITIPNSLTSVKDE